jgi:3-(3-hydroxy-phenyl)propionate hydroxylase
MRFMVPHGIARRLARNTILRGSIRSDFLRRRVNSGRLSQPFSYSDSPVVAPDHDDDRLPSHGAVAPDAACSAMDPDEDGVTRLHDLVGGGFLALLVVSRSADEAAAMAIRAAGFAWPAPCRIAALGPDRPLRHVTVLQDVAGELRRHYGAAGPRAWLIRPDGHLAGSLPLSERHSVDGLPALQAAAIGDRQHTAAEPQAPREPILRDALRRRFRRAG